MKIGRGKLGKKTIVFLSTKDETEVFNNNLFHSILRNPLEFQSQGDKIVKDDLSLLAPVSPSKIVCVGRNYQDHARELGNPIPDEPLLFLKPPSTIIGPGQAILHPPRTNNLQFEGEIALVMRKRIRQASVKELESIPDLFGITLFNDVTARDLQREDKTWLRGKGHDTFAPIGPHVILSPLQSEYDISTKLNGKVVQKSNTRYMKFQFLDIISYISEIMTLELGDVIPTGTPAGVAPMKIGDLVEIASPQIGVLHNPVESWDQRKPLIL